jgi:hypothetical protein
MNNFKPTFIYSLFSSQELTGRGAWQLEKGILAWFFAHQWAERGLPALRLAYRTIAPGLTLKSWPFSLKMFSPVIKGFSNLRNR